MIDRGNQLLAIVMGGGKTTVALAAIEELARRGDIGSGIVLASSSYQFQWYDAIRRYTGSTAQVITGSREQRVWQYKWTNRFRYNIMGYETFVNDLKLLTHRGMPHFLIPDEATAIKGFRTKRSRAVKWLGKELDVRFALTGQPIENRPEELFSIMEFVDRDVLGPFPTFERTFIRRDAFGRPTRYSNMSLLQRTMADAMMRRSREDIKQWLPVIMPKQQWVPLPPKVQALYDFIVADTLRVLNAAITNGAMGTWNVMANYGRAEDHKGSAMGEVMSRLTCMRMLCDHPALLKMSADQFDDPDTKRGSAYAHWLRENGYLDGLGTATDDTKLKACVDALAQILSEDPANKVVVFAYFKPLLRMLGEQITNRLRKPWALITGDHSATQRRDALHRFAGGVPILLSSDAGQYGVDLPHCNHLISYDLPWSAGAYAQRVARIDRISSVWPHVTVMTLLTQDTIEHRQFDMLRQKNMVAEAWLDGVNIDAKDGVTLTLESLREFLLAS